MINENFEYFSSEDDDKKEFQEEYNNELEYEDNETESVEIKERKLFTDKTDRSVSDLVRMINEKELILRPEYQRKFIWNSSTQSRFIESLLINIPIPTIFWAENKDGTYEVIDGQQRLSTIHRFLRNEFKLTKIDTLSEYKGKYYNDLQEVVRKKLNNTSLPIVIVLKESTPDIKYSIFSRINQGSVVLKQQELLNVIYRGALITAIKNVSESTHKFYDVQLAKMNISKTYLTHQEMVLRYYAMLKKIDRSTWKSTPEYNGRLNKAILTYLEQYRESQEEVEFITNDFINTIDKIDVVFGQDSYQKYLTDKQSYSNQINRTIAELQMVVLSKFPLDSITRQKDKIKKAFEQFCIDKENDSIFDTATNNTSRVDERYQWGSIVEGIINERDN